MAETSDGEQTMAAVSKTGIIRSALAMAVALLAVVLVSAGVLNPNTAGAEVIDHQSLVPEEPERGYPRILDTPSRVVFSPNCVEGCDAPRGTLAVNLVDDYLVSGGDFLTIERQNGQEVSSPYLAVFDTRTQDLACEDLSVSNEVLAIAPGPDAGSMIIGGRFNRITDADGTVFRSRIAKVDLTTCTVDRSWDVGGVNSRVDEFAISGNRLFFGGSFVTVAGEPIEKLAEVNLTTAALNPDFTFDFDVQSPIKAIGASPDGTRLGIVHSGTSIDGVDLRGTAIFDISSPQSPTLTAHRMRTGIPAFDDFAEITEGAVASDFSSFAIAGGTRTRADYITKIGTGEAPDQFDWQHFMRDSNFSVAISNHAIYAGGHFCFIEAGPGPTETLSPNTGPSECTGNIQHDDGAYRSQLAALDLDDGTPLSWNPGSDAFRGVSALTVVPRGLLVGHDGTRINRRNIGTTAFFDFGAPIEPEPPQPEPPAPNGQTCTATQTGPTTVVLTWTAIPGENNYIVRRNNAWLTTPGNVLTYTDRGATDASGYLIRSFSPAGQTNTECTVDDAPPQPPPGQDQTCTATPTGGNVVLTWTAVPGNPTYTVRQNNSWVTTPGQVLTTTINNTNDATGFVIRSFINNVRIAETFCTVNEGEPPPPEPPVGGQTCTLVTNGNGTVSLNWSPVAGENLYSIRRNNSWVADSTATSLSTTGSTADSFVIRSRQRGTTTNTTCV